MPAQEATASAVSNRHPSSSEPAERYGQSVTPRNSSHGVIGTCIFTALGVLAAYAHLLVISIDYIKLAIIPVIMLAFIGAVACKFHYYSNSSGGGWQQNDSNSETGFANRVEMVALAAVTLVPHLLQLLCSRSGLEKLLVGNQQQQHASDDSSFLISHFLFFSSSCIGALQVMMVTLRVPKVSQVLRMTFIALLSMAMHARGAELVGEDMVLVCIPELVAGLLWFTGHFDHGGGGGYTTTAKCIGKVILSLKSGVITLSAVVILVSSSMFATTDTDRSVVVPSTFFRVFVSCTLAGMLSYFSMWAMISGTGSHDHGDSAAEVPIQLLRFSAFVCFGMSAVLVSVLAILHVVHPLAFCFLLNCGILFLHRFWQPSIHRPPASLIRVLSWPHHGVNVHCVYTRLSD